jgi:hypothetical protein
MYSTCLYCHSSLGKNEIIERFPVGRRLAFDAAKGRLWVVCIRCTRWSLTPLEERWEAIEQCERVFRDTKLRVSTDNIGMARLREGLELIRVGRALRPEIVVWRYGAANQARRRRSLVITAVIGGAWWAGYYAGAAAAGPVGLAAMTVMPLIRDHVEKRLRGRHRPLVVPHGRQRLVVTREQAVRALIVAKNGGDWALRLEHHGGTVTIADESRLQRLAALMASINDTGVSKRSVQEGERLLTKAASTERLIASHGTSSAIVEAMDAPFECPADESPYYFRQKTVAQLRAEGFSWGRTVPPAAVRVSSIAGLAPPVRAALEMAANEAAERRAMEGELAALEESWREAEEIASIADNLFLPASVNEAMERLRSER